MKIILVLLALCSKAYCAPMLSRELSPKFPLGYYADQSNKYFNTLDSYTRRDGKPKYSKKVIRYEWSPWLKLTGYKSWMMKLDFFLTLYPTKVTNRICQGFDIQPFGRCHVTFIYKGHEEPVDIYEEFTFNDQGEITFIEAWTDSPMYFPSPNFKDYWAQDNEALRLSTVVPGLGRSDGKIDPRSSEFKKAARENTLVNDLAKRLKRPLYYWTKELVIFLKRNNK
jgi:hypothetical protein